VDFLRQNIWGVRQVANAVNEHALVDRNSPSHGVTLDNSPKNRRQITCEKSQYSIAAWKKPLSVRWMFKRLRKGFGNATKTGEGVFTSNEATMLLPFKFLKAKPCFLPGKQKFSFA
jgi:hypothetical protein